MEMHTFDNLGLLDVVTRTIGRGVSVTILLEGGPVGGIDDQELWVCQQIESAGGQCWFMISNTSNGNTIHARYDYLHAKMIVVDDRVVAIGSENLSPRSLTYDDPADGTIGHRGVYLVTDASGVVSRSLEIWQRRFRSDQSPRSVALVAKSDGNLWSAATRLCAQLQHRSQRLSHSLSAAVGRDRGRSRSNC